MTVRAVFRRTVGAQWPILLVGSIFAVGFVLAGANFWRRGALLIGIGVGVAAGAGENLGVDDVGLALAHDRTPQPGAMPRAGHVHGVTGILDSDRERQPRHRGRFHGGVDIVVTAELVGEGAQSGQRGFDTESNRPRTDIIADRDVVTGRDRRVDSDQRPPAPSWILGSHGLALLCMEVLPFIVNHVVLMKSSRIPGPTQPTVVRELVAVGEPSYTALPAGLPHHPRPQRGGSSRAAPVLVDDSMPHPGGHGLYRIHH